MAAARYSQDVLEEFFVEIQRRKTLQSPTTDVDLEEIFNHDFEEIFDLNPAVLDVEMAIQNLPTEIREKIYKELVGIKMRERKEKGWNEVHDEIQNAPFCEKRLRITKVLFCFKCNSCQRNGLCEVCHKNRETHNLGYPMYGIEDYDEIFIKAY